MEFGQDFLCGVKIKNWSEIEVNDVYVFFMFLR